MHDNGEAAGAGGGLLPQRGVLNNPPPKNKAPEDPDGATARDGGGKIN